MDSRTILALTVADLKEKLASLNLSTTGRKSVLQDRLLEHFNLDDQDIIEEETAPAAAVSVYDDADSIPLVQTPVFTLRDIRDSLNNFYGNNRPEIESWLDEFEENALSANWGELQKYIYAKQLIKGAAKIFLRSQPDIKSWSSLRTILIKEFGNKCSALDIHRKLDSRQKRHNETYLEYLYSLMEIGQSINLDEKSLIGYFIEGIPDSKYNKSILYNANSIEALKIQIEAYEKIKTPSRNKDRFTNYNQKILKKCTRCPHLSNHNTEDCRKQDFTCFKCKGKGHRSFECKSEVETNQQQTRNMYRNTENRNPLRNTENRNMNRNTENRTRVNVQQEQYGNRDLQTRLYNAAIRIFKEVSCNNLTFSALLDTGSDVCLITKTVFNKLNVELIKTPAQILGIAQQKMVTIGFIEIEITMDNIKFECTFHVADDEDLGHISILGNDILKKVDINLTSEGAKFSLKTENNKLPTTYNNNFVAGMEYKALCSYTSEKPDEIKVPEYLTETEKSQLKYLIKNYSPTQEVEPPTEMSIIVIDDKPVFQRPRRIPLADQRIVEEQTKDWLEKGIIRESKSEYTSPIVLVPKKDGSKRLCCDYRKINEKIVRDNFPMILIDDALHKLQGANIFTTIDLKNGFFHVPVKEESKKYTSFVTHNNQFEFNFVPFGISNSPAEFCRFIHAVFRDMILSNKIIAYLDDLIIPAKTVQEGLKLLTETFQIAEKNNLQINWAKCQFLQKSVTFLGFIISNSSIKPSKEKTNAVMNFKAPTDQKSLQRFLGLTSYFRRFIQNYSLIAKPLSDLLSKTATFKFETEQELAFKELKLALAQAPVLKLYNPKAYTEVHTDASMYGFGAVLLQKDAETQQLHPVEFMSRKTNHCEQKYHSYELEVLAIIDALKKWRCFLLGKHFKIVTDCNAFKGTVNKQDVPVRVSRWIMFLQDFDFDVEHRAGTKMRHVDALSRVYALVLQNPLSQKIITAQQKDPWIKIIREITEKEGPGEFFLKYNILYKDPAKELIVIPQSLEKEIIEMAHKQGHFASKKTAEIVNKSFYIQDLENKAKMTVQNCIQCILTEAKAGKKEGLTQPVTKSHKPLDTLHIDHIGPLDTTKKQFNFILTIVDSFSKFTWIYPTKSTTAEEVLDRLEKHAAIFGYPNRIVSDKGSAFTSHIFQEYCQANNINHYLITTGVPRENGQVERIHRIIISVLAKLCLEKKENWYKHTNKVQQFINSTPPRSTKVSPFRILTGIEMKLPGLEDIAKLIDEEILEEFDNNRNEIRDTARQNIEKIQRENAKEFNKNRKIERAYQIGDLVAIKRTQFGTNLKIKPKFHGPYKVTKIKRLGRYEVEKVGESDGPRVTSTIAEYLKPWCSTFETNVQSG